MAVTIDLNGKVCVVTGGTRGVGRGISQRLQEAGATVVAVGRNAPESPPDGMHFVSCDVRDADAVDAAVTEIHQTHGRLDVWVNNAGGSPAADTATASPRFSAAIIALNLTAPLVCAQKANAIMQTQASGGLIINIASVSGLRASPGTAAYGAAKAGLLNLTRTLGVEWAPRVRVNAIAAGPIETEQRALHYGDQAGVDAVAATIPMGRLGTPEDVGNLVVLLAAAGAGYLTGTTLVMDGGGEKPAFLDAAAQAAKRGMGE